MILNSMNYSVYFMFSIRLQPKPHHYHFTTELSNHSYNCVFYMYCQSISSSIFLYTIPTLLYSGVYCYSFHWVIPYENVMYLMSTNAKNMAYCILSSLSTGQNLLKTYSPTTYSISILLYSVLSSSSFIPYYRYLNLPFPTL